MIYFCMFQPPPQSSNVQPNKILFGSDFIKYTLTCGYSCIKIHPNVKYIISNAFSTSPAPNQIQIYSSLYENEHFYLLGASGLVLGAGIPIAQAIRNKNDPIAWMMGGFTAGAVFALKREQLRSGPYFGSFYSNIITIWMLASWKIDCIAIP